MARNFNCELRMLNIIYYFVICILFYCPFQMWFLKNRCCVNCRIYNWDYAFLFTPFLTPFRAYFFFFLSFSETYFLPGNRLLYFSCSACCSFFSKTTSTILLISSVMTSDNTLLIII